MGEGVEGCRKRTNTREGAEEQEYVLAGGVSGWRMGCGEGGE